MKQTDGNQKAYIRLIEAEIRTHHQTKRQLEFIYANKEYHLRISSQAVLYLEYITSAIDDVLKRMEGKNDGESRLKMIRLKYWDKKYNDKGIMLQLHIGKTTFYRWKKEFIEMVGNELGFPSFKSG